MPHSEVSSSSAALSSFSSHLLPVSPESRDSSRVPSSQLALCKRRGNASPTPRSRTCSSCRPQQWSEYRSATPAFCVGSSWLCWHVIASADPFTSLHAQEPNATQPIQSGSFLSSIPLPAHFTSLLVPTATSLVRVSFLPSRFKLKGGAHMLT